MVMKDIKKNYVLLDIIRSVSILKLFLCEREVGILSNLLTDEKEVQSCRTKSLLQLTGQTKMKAIDRPTIRTARRWFLVA
jgi:hypothetical protein